MVLYFPKPALAWGLTAHNAVNEPTPFSTRKTIGSASGPVNRITQQAINLRLNSYTFGLFADHFASSAANRSSGDGSWAAVVAAQSASTAIMKKRLRRIVNLKARYREL